ncbi:MAG: hypothetical protein JWL92_164 [Candidatus Nomurabacteria bacterium]|nr:hypothetical protein [Candidatus Nomurabacteria bacterium]
MEIQEHEQERTNTTSSKQADSHSINQLEVKAGIKLSGYDLALALLGNGNRRRHSKFRTL